METLIDVIVPVYNVEKYLGKCLDSLVKQTIPIKIILVDDGSTDNSCKIINEYINKYSNIILLSKENGGLSQSRNYGLNFATSKFVSFMDSDDWVDNRFYEEMINTIEFYSASVCCSDIYYFYNKNKIINKKAINVNKKYISGNDDKYVNHILNIFPMMQNKLWRNDSNFRKYKFLEGLLYEDLDFFYRIYPSLKNICFSDKAKFYYRQRSNSLVKNFNRVKDIIPISNNIIKFYKDNNLYEMYKDEIEYLIIRNTLYSSLRRVGYSCNFHIIYNTNLYLLNYINNTFKDWKQNKYLHVNSISSILLKSYNKLTLVVISFLVKILFFLKKYNRYTKELL